MPTDSQERKDVPVYSGCVAYFPLALAEVARLSMAGNDKHNPGQPLHWSRDKSADHLDCVARHLLECGDVDTDGFLHDVKVAWRALANLQIKMEQCSEVNPWEHRAFVKAKAFGMAEPLQEGGTRNYFGEEEDPYKQALARGQAALAWQGYIDNQDDKVK